MEEAGELSAPKSLDEGKQLAERYIELCIQTCRIYAKGEGGPIGGRIHSAAVTPKGFEWKTKPKG
jgi:hypothetical protein